MSELRLEAISLIDEISDENLGKVVNFLKNLVQKKILSGAKKIKNICRNQFVK